MNEKNLTKLFLIFLGIASMIGTANATVTYNPTYPTIAISAEDGEHINLTLIYDKLVSQYGESTVQNNILEEVSPKVWLSKTKINFVSGTFYINDTDCTELRMGGAYTGVTTGIWENDAHLEMSNVSVYGWNLSSDTMRGKDSTFALYAYGNISNCEFQGLQKVYMGESYSKIIKNTLVHNCKEGIYLREFRNATMHNVTVRDNHAMCGNGFRAGNMYDSNISNINILNVSDPANEATGSYGFQMYARNCTLRDIYVNGCAYSGISLNGINNTLNNITVLYAHHNGFEMFADDSYVKNVTVSYSADHNIFSTQDTHGIIFDGVTCLNNGSGYNILTSERSSDLTFKNLTLTGKDGFAHQSTVNMTVLNCTQTGGSQGAFLTYLSSLGPESKDHKIIDTSYSDNSYANVYMYNSGNVRLLNTYAPTIRLIYGDYLQAYYIDVMVEGDNREPLPNSTITLTNEGDESFTSIDGYCINKTTFITDSTGRTLLPNDNRSGTPAIIERHRNSGESTEYYTYSTEISTTLGNVTLSGITPDSSWYRPDPNIPTYTITAIIPNDSLTGPRITGFAPSEENLFNQSNEKIFRVWTDEPLANMTWSVDGVNKSEGALSYTLNLTEVNYTIKFIGSNANGNVSQSWDIREEEPVIVQPQDTSTVAVTPDDQTVTPNQPFTIDVRINPSTPIVAAQFDLQFDSSMVRADSVTEGNLLSQDGAGTYFESTINNSEGTVTDVHGVIIGKTNVSSEGVFATISMTAGNKTGISELNLSNVRVLDTNITDVPISISNATVLVDTAPVLNSIGNKSVSESNTLSFTVDASDADGDSLTYSATGLPEGANFDPATGEFTWTPATGQAGVYTVTFEVSDGYLTDPEDATITVKSPNNAPVIDSFEPKDGSSFNESEEIRISVSAFDLDEQLLNYIIRINGTKCSTDPNYIWKTNYSSSGEYEVEVTVSDGIDQVKENHTIYINEYYPEWDVVINGKVDIVDLATVGQNFETPVSKPYPRYDVNQDGRVNIHDLTIVGYHFGEKIQIE